MFQIPPGHAQDPVGGKKRGVKREKERERVKISREGEKERRDEDTEEPINSKPSEHSYARDTKG